MYYNLQKLSTIQKLQNIISTFFKYGDKNDREEQKIISNTNFDLNNNILTKLYNLIDNIETSAFKDIQENGEITNVINYNELKKIFSFSHNLNMYNNTFYCTLEIMNKFFKNCKITEVLELDYQENTSKFKDSLMYFYKNNEEQINIHNIDHIFKNKDDIFNLNKFIQVSINMYNHYHIAFINVEPVVFNNIEYEMNEVLLIYIILSLNVIKEDGNCIIKLDLNSISNVLYLEIFFFLSSIFKSVTLCKPKCSILNERIFFIICKNKNIFIKDEIIDVTIPVFQNIVEKPKNKFTYSFLKYDIPLFYKNKIFETFINFQRYEVEVFDHMCNFLLSSKQNDKITNQISKQKYRLQKWIDENSHNCRSVDFCKVNHVQNHNETFFWDL